jgi:hypothetical protein
MVQSYFDNANLYRKYGVDKATPKKAGEYRTVGQEREVEIVLTLSELTETETIQDDTVVIPAGALIKEVELFTTTAAATGTAIDVGLIRQTDRSTEIDYNGLVNAEVTADMEAGEQNTFNFASIGASAGGALIGTVLANNGHISASRTTATAFTAGVVRCIVRFIVP